MYVDILKHTTSYYRMVSLYNMDWRHLSSKKWLPPTSLCRDQCLMQRSVLQTSMSGASVVCQHRHTKQDRNGIWKRKKGKERERPNSSTYGIQVLKTNSCHGPKTETLAKEAKPRATNGFLWFSQTAHQPWQAVAKRAGHNANLKVRQARLYRCQIAKAYLVSIWWSSAGAVRTAYQMDRNTGIQDGQPGTTEIQTRGVPHGKVI